MSKLIELYWVFSEKVGEAEAQLLVEAREEVAGRREDLQRLARLTEKRFQRLEEEVREVHRRLWWLVGLILAQWLTVMIALLVRG